MLFVSIHSALKKAINPIDGVTCGVSYKLVEYIPLNIFWLINEIDIYRIHLPYKENSLEISIDFIHNEIEKYHLNYDESMPYESLLSDAGFQIAGYWRIRNINISSFENDLFCRIKRVLFKDEKSANLDDSDRQKEFIPVYDGMSCLVGTLSFGSNLINEKYDITFGLNVSRLRFFDPRKGVYTNFKTLKEMCSFITKHMNDIYSSYFKFCFMMIYECEYEMQKYGIKSIENFSKEIITY